MLRIDVFLKADGDTPREVHRFTKQPHGISPGWEVRGSFLKIEDGCGGSWLYPAESLRAVEIKEED